MNKTISELGIDVIGGQIISRVVADEKRGDKVLEERGTIIAKTITSGYVCDADIAKNKIRCALDEKRLTKEGDVVIKIAPPFAAALIDKDHTGLLVSSFCVILTGFNDMISPAYLTAYLNSDDGKNQVTRNMNGSTITTISVSNIRELSIPVPSKEKQEEIGDEFKKYVRNIFLCDKLLKLQQEKINTLIANEKEF